ncbi:MAG TPA: DNA repair protein RecN [Myxococcota bacterium]|nr:DNA repair protein RecN [Myxococcota bacterium]
MIESLRIEGLAIVERAELEFAPGLNVLTGETGAGKSVVLGALGLLAGARAAPRLVREGHDEATVEGLFRTGACPELEAELARRGLACEDHELVLHRSVSREGRSRARIGGELVPVGTLAELLRGRLEISSQHDSQSLLQGEVHGRLLDRYGGCLPLRGEVAGLHQRLRELDGERAALLSAASARLQRQDFLAYAVREIDAAELDPEEIESLRALRSRLVHVERLRAEGGAALARLIGDPSSDARAASDLVAEAVRSLSALASLDPVPAAQGERLAAALVELLDVAADVERWLDALDADPARLAAAEERLHTVERLLRKYGGEVSEALAQRERLAAELAGIEGADARMGELESLRAKLVAELEERARELSRRRAQAGEKLAEEVESALRELAMPHASFAVSLPPAPAQEGLPCSANGFESPAFVFSANRGEPLRPLREIASGGELSRTFLALKQALREEEAGMVLVFDEVDAALGGEAANRVGRQLASLGARHQVLCITHLPQIAACGDVHFRVVKRPRGDRTTVRIERLDGDARVEEIARMAGGRAAGDAAREYARALLRAR